MKITINWTEKEVEFKTYTRKVDREFNWVLFEWTNIWTDWQLKIDPMNMQKANDFLITSLTNLTQDEVDNLEISTYNEILDKVWVLKNGSKK